MIHQGRLNLKNTTCGVVLLIFTLNMTGCQRQSANNEEQAEPSVKVDQSSEEAKTIASEKAGATTTVPLIDQIVEASCGECQFGMEGSSCDLAIRIDGESYFVDGTGIDDHGDAHGKDGMCNCVRKAKVSGELKDGRFKATSFEVLKQDH